MSSAFASVVVLSTSTWQGKSLRLQAEMPCARADQVCEIPGLIDFILNLFEDGSSRRQTGAQGGFKPAVTCPAAGEI